ncbi:hypothetical protein C6503_13595 [Candidatus Poribacteria bacterium]|nr:MAG: hypothetical protein C6503_13595 [Candidatus Poribacteria bacterium]
MKHAFLFAGLLVIGGLVGLWMAKPKGQPEVITIYKTVPYEPKRISTTQTTHLTASSTQTQGSEKKYTHGLSAGEVSEDMLSVKEELSAAEKTEFLEWLTALEAELPIETTNEETEEEMESGKDTTTEMPYKELRDMVVAGYELEDILSEYGVFPDNLGKSTCPKCPSTEFTLMLYVPTGRYETWCCMDCKDGAYNVIDFVAWMEGTDDLQGVAMRLAERAGLLE